MCIPPYAFLCIDHWSLAWIFVVSVTADTDFSYCRNFDRMDSSELQTFVHTNYWWPIRVLRSSLRSLGHDVALWHIFMFFSSENCYDYRLSVRSTLRSILWIYDPRHRKLKIVSIFYIASCHRHDKQCMMTDDTENEFLSNERASLSSDLNAQRQIKKTQWRQQSSQRDTSVRQS